MRSFNVNSIVADAFLLFKKTAKIDVKNAKEGHRLAQNVMDIINKSEFESCDFQYNYKKKVARYALSGSSEFLITALNIVRKSGYDSL